MLIRIKAGTASYYDGRKRHMLTPRDGAVDVPDAVAKRWVDIGSAVPVKSNPPSAPKPEPKPGPKPEDSGATDYKAMTVRELKAECDARGLEYPPDGRKSPLISLLRDDDKTRSGSYPFGALEAE